jgi:hypothetical protein
MKTREEGRGSYQVSWLCSVELIIEFVEVCERNLLGKLLLSACSDCPLGKNMIQTETCKTVIAFCRKSILMTLNEVTDNKRQGSTKCLVRLL